MKRGDHGVDWHRLRPRRRRRRLPTPHREALHDPRHRCAAWIWLAALQAPVQAPMFTGIGWDRVACPPLAARGDRLLTRPVPCRRTRASSRVQGGPDVRRDCAGFRRRQRTTGWSRSPQRLCCRSWRLRRSDEAGRPRAAAHGPLVRVSAARYAPAVSHRSGGAGWSRKPTWRTLVLGSTVAPVDDPGMHRHLLSVNFRYVTSAGSTHEPGGRRRSRCVLNTVLWLVEKATLKGVFCKPNKNIFACNSFKCGHLVQTGPRPWSWHFA